MRKFTEIQNEQNQRYTNLIHKYYQDNFNLFRRYLNSVLYNHYFKLVDLLSQYIVPYWKISNKQIVPEKTSFFPRTFIV